MKFRIEKTDEWRHAWLVMWVTARESTHLWVLQLLGKCSSAGDGHGVGYC